MTPRRSVFLRPAATKSCRTSKKTKTMQNSHVFSKINTKKTLTVWYNKANKNSQRKG